MPVAPGHLPAPVMCCGAPLPSRPTSSCPRTRWGPRWGAVGAWLSLSEVSAAVLGSATSPSAGGPAAAGALALHLLLVLAQRYVSASVQALPIPPSPVQGG